MKCKCVCPWCTVKPKKHNICNWNCRIRVKKTTPSELFEGKNSSLRKTYEKAVTPHEPTGWEIEVHNEIHLLVARVQATYSLDEQIEHGNDFVGRFKSFILEEKSKSYAEGQRDEREAIMGEIENYSTVFEVTKKSVIDIIKSRGNK